MLMSQIIPLKKRVTSLMDKPDNDIVIDFDGRELADINFNFIAQLSEILSNDEELEVGEFELGIFTVTVNRIKTYEEELIVCKRS